MASASAGASADASAVPPLAPALPPVPALPPPPLPAPLAPAEPPAPALPASELSSELQCRLARRRRMMGALRVASAVPMVLMFLVSLVALAQSLARAGIWG